MKKTIKIISIAVLCSLLVIGGLVFKDTIDLETNKTVLLVLSIAWFATAPLWMKKQA